MKYIECSLTKHTKTVVFNFKGTPHFRVGSAHSMINVVVTAQQIIRFEYELLPKWRRQRRLLYGHRAVTQAFLFVLRRSIHLTQFTDCSVKTVIFVLQHKFISTFCFVSFFSAIKSRMAGVVICCVSKALKMVFQLNAWDSSAVPNSSSQMT